MTLASLRRTFAALLVAATAAAAQDAPPDATWTGAYPWLAEWRGNLPPVQPLEERFPVPPGHVRVSLEAHGFGAWLRGLPIRLDRSEVRSYLGREVFAPAAAVVALDLGGGDLQQCADTILRLHAEYL
jgi:hypothetical protein